MGIIVNGRNHACPSGKELRQAFHVHLDAKVVHHIGHLSSKIIDYVQKNYTHTLTLEQMARDLGYNYTYLSAYFNHSLHTGFQGFINQYRISHAAALLQGSSLPITQVAEQCGFGTIRSFNRVFLKEKGMTPSAFRKQNVL